MEIIIILHNMITIPHIGLEPERKSPPKNIISVINTDTKASVKKKFQCIPYSVTCS